MKNGRLGAIPLVLLVGCGGGSSNGASRGSTKSADFAGEYVGEYILHTQVVAASNSTFASAAEGKATAWVAATGAFRIDVGQGCRIVGTLGDDGASTDARVEYPVAGVVASSPLEKLSFSNPGSPLCVSAAHARVEGAEVGYDVDLRKR